MPTPTQIFARRALSHKIFLRDGQRIAAAKKLRLRTPRDRVGQSSCPRPPKIRAGFILFKTDFSIGRMGGIGFWG